MTQAQYTEALGAVEFARDGVEAARRAEAARAEGERQAQLDALATRLRELDGAALEKARTAAARAVGAYVEALEAQQTALADIWAGIGSLGTWAAGKAEVSYRGITIGAASVPAPRPEWSLFRLVETVLRERGSRLSLHWNPGD